MSDTPDWAVDGAGWPNRAASRFVEAGGLRWHVQIAGDGPVLLLLHGTGAATHSWGDLLPLLTPHFRIVAPDLPGHGFTAVAPPVRMSLPGMADAVTDLLRVLDVAPDLAAGHSAGVAVLARMCLDGGCAPRMVFSLNGALLPLQSRPMQLFAPLAKLLSANPLVPRLFAWHAADRRVVERLLRNTGSMVPARSVDGYARLARRSGHAAAALTMMANWNLAPLLAELCRLKPALVLINGGNDRTIPPREAATILDQVPGAELVMLPGLGHLAHEEAPQQVASIMLEYWARAGAGSPP